VGATGSTTISYVLPGLVYFYSTDKWSPLRVAALILLCAGLIIIPSCLTFIFAFGASGG
jgi:hypothetical protein